MTDYSVKCEPGLHLAKGAAFGQAGSPEPPPAPPEPKKPTEADLPENQPEYKNP